MQIGSAGVALTQTLSLVWDNTRPNTECLTWIEKQNIDGLMMIPE